MSKSLSELQICVEDDIELMGDRRIVYLKKTEGVIVDYDYFPAEDYEEAITLKDLQEKLSVLSMTKDLEQKPNTEQKKLAVIFPGIGYTCDKPLLYYSIRLAKGKGYEVVTVDYKGFPPKVKGDTQKMEESLRIAKEQTVEILKQQKWDEYDEIVFISKSIGTVAASWFAKEHKLSVKSIFMTPLTETYQYADLPAIAFHGSQDPWADTEEICRLSKEKEIPLYLTEGGNHSLETGEIEYDLNTLRNVMHQLENYLI